MRRTPSGSMRMLESVTASNSIDDALFSASESEGGAELGEGRNRATKSLVALRSSRGTIVVFVVVISRKLQSVGKAVLAIKRRDLFIHVSTVRSVVRASLRYELQRM